METANTKMQFNTIAFPVVALSLTINTASAADTSEQSKTAGSLIQDKMSSGNPGPEMIVIPSGSFNIGSPEAEVGRESAEGPRQEIRIASFAMGKNEITLGQFNVFIDATNYRTSSEILGGCWVWGTQSANFGTQRTKWLWKADKNWRNPGFEQAQDHPVLCVNRTDAMAYAAWLSEQTGKSYRLPGEAEWEYAARAASTTIYHWGNVISHNDSNYGKEKCCGGYVKDADRWMNTAPVGSFPGNALGLHDMHGNVTEMTADCWHYNYEGIPTDGGVWMDNPEGDCSRYVARGGSWFDAPLDLRAAHRFSEPNEPSYTIGFRLARDL